MKPLLVAFALCLLAQGRCLAFEAVQVPYDKPFRSPDGRFVAVLPHPSPTQLGQLLITDTSSHQSTEHGGQRPLYSIRWSGDSQTLVTIEHVAHGSIMALRHFEGGQWQRHDVEPSGDALWEYSVVRQRIHSDTVDVTYRVTEMHVVASEKKPSYFVCTLHVDCATGATLKVSTKRALTRRAFERLAVWL